MRPPSLGTQDPAQVVVAVCAVVGIAVAAWLALSLLVAVVDEVRVRRSPRRTVRLTPGVPALVRRLATLGVGLVLGSAALSAQAAAPGVPEVGWATAATATVDPGWPVTGPTRPDAPPAPRPAAQARPVPSGTGEVVVLRGDSLWSLAAHRLGPGATGAEVLAEQHRLYAANADVIGQDPDRLLPGQVLRLP
ncbi:LysM peptidoglycan-binding domain-containing protein [Kineococcus sp. LSe6-4]|uniref:LysM peptidoglycan-binding domain-containing protein n=1 Tax=Kineococcus halophytocola TaxID=3234027 RepID=A0ABV4H1V0_9ACTN